MSAFTLVEMMIVVLIISIAASLVVPSLGDTAVSKLRAAATQVAADLAHAQMESIAHSDALRVVVLDPTNNRYHIALASATGTPLTHPITKAPYRITFGEGIAHTLSGVTLSASVGGDNQLKFLSYGQLDQAIDATITLSCDGFTCTLTINATSGEAVIGDIQ